MPPHHQFHDASATPHLCRRLLLEDTPLDLVELAADALLPLLMSEPATYQALAASLAAAQLDPAAQQRVAGALAGVLAGQQLQGAPGGTPDRGRANKRLFRQALSSMVTDVRGLVRMR